jgi:hypothetical protein
MLYPRRLESPKQAKFKQSVLHKIHKADATVRFYGSADLLVLLLLFHTIYT